MSIPHSACLLTISATLRRKVAAYLSASYGWPLTFAFITSSSSVGRARLPQCVVRMRFVLCFMSILLSDWRMTDSLWAEFRFVPLRAALPLLYVEATVLRCSRGERIFDGYSRNP